VFIGGAVLLSVPQGDFDRVLLSVGHAEEECLRPEGKRHKKKSKKE
jgi:hypothetical protein